MSHNTLYRALLASLFALLCASSSGMERASLAEEREATFWDGMELYYSVVAVFETL